MPHLSARRSPCLPCRPVPLLVPSLRPAGRNVAAINNNPFEYWITYPDAKYVELMQGVQEFVSAPGARDVPVHEVFTDSMAKELFTELASRQIAGLSEVEKLWSQQYRCVPPPSL